MAAAASSSSSLYRGPWKYDVFLNFRGKDTLKIFVGHLSRVLDQKVINSFVDAQELRKGNNLPELLLAINDSKLSIVVFSRNYAYSTCCLRELVKILECMDTKDQIVVPIFYQVDPSNIRKLKGSFAKALDEHKHNVDEKELQSWSSALTRTTNLSGWDSRDYKNDAKLIEDIAQDTSNKLIEILSRRYDRKKYKIVSCTSPTTYDVFLNFRGDDTRKIFVGHLYKALEQKEINTFIDSEEVGKGNNLSMLEQGIQDSRISIVVFSENYASSTWCLKELVRILKCMDIKKQIVVPIFYELDPFDVRNLKGSFAEAFAKHENSSNTNKEEVESWKSALTRVTNLSCWDSRKYEDDAKLVEEIVIHVNELVHVWSSKANSLVGMNSRIKEMDLLLCHGIYDVRVVGIWGMVGIGKTTIARAVYDKIARQFEHSCFLENVKERFMKNDALQMQEELLSRMLKEKVRGVGTLSRGSKMMMERLGNRKVLLVLDDVENTAQIEALLGKQHSFGPGSKIIITSRDLQALSRVDETYVPKFLSDDEALELFRNYAFRRNQPTGEYDELSRHAVEYAQGLPLALRVMGSALHNKSVCEWEDVLEKTKKFICHNDLITSFEVLNDSEKEIFLDISCFFKGMEKDYVTEILDSCGFFPERGLRVLVNRALVSVTRDNKLEMHKLLQRMGWEIVRQQEHGKPSRLWSNKDIQRLLTQNMATERIESIKLDLCNSKDVYINTKSFNKMTRLRLVRINYSLDRLLPAIPSADLKQYVSGDLKFLSDELRLLCWHGCPYSSLPSNFRPRNLIDLDLRFSHIQQLWEGTKLMKMLKSVNLSHSIYLDRIPDFSEAINLEKLILDGCLSLVGVHPSISALQNLVVLTLNGCEKLQDFPSSMRMKSLKTFQLSGCSRFEKFPKISEAMEELSELCLDGTAIKELPSSIELLQGLELLSMRNCRSLVRLPHKICNLANLQQLYLAGCSKLHSLPSNFGNLASLTDLEVQDSGIKQLPFSVLHLSKLKGDALSCIGCKQMTTPFSAWPSSVEKCSSYSVLVHLDLSDCNLLEISNGIAHLCSLETLKMCRNNLESLPATMNQLGRLTHLELEACKRLKSIPQLSSSVKYIDAHDCTALESVSTPNPPYKKNLWFTFSNCFPLVQTNLFIDVVETHSYHQGDLQPLSFYMCLPGREIPAWFSHQCRGSSITVQLPPNCFHDNFLGFSICIACNFEDACNYPSDLSALCFCTAKGNHGEHSFQLLHPGFRTDRLFELDHMFLVYVPWFEYHLIEEGDPVNEGYFTEVTFSIIVESDSTAKQFHCITSCGVRIFYVNQQS